ncbi:two-component system regulatory protein YycI [Falsibacillus albus]|uniref:Transcriptional regulator n=1 Tax=Falsibacillus albus TaxID=2478915 RepID=A0A3L7JWF6_9BACI|nr:two-component system regulatory protein YycI [Falsibacillus albus]RLQ93991.1 transcriptional regulator [Falsibacillus albus]
MDWNKTKTIFIIVFLVLDVFLLSQLIKKNTASKAPLKRDASIEEQLKAAGIHYEPIQDDKEKNKQYLLYAKTKNFTEEEVSKLENQDVKIEGKTKLRATLDKPFKLGAQFEPDVLDTFVKSNILNGAKYHFWRYDKDLKQITYSQQYKDNQIFENVNGQLTLYLDDDNEVIGYEQTMLDSIDEYNKEQIITGFQAIITLFNKGMIKPDSNIKKPELGYYTLVQNAESQVLTPTWHLIVENGDKKENMFVNAFEGSVITTEKKLE